MAKRAVFWLGTIAAIAVFVIAEGLSNYQIARSAPTRVVVDGKELDLLSLLVWDTFRVIPFGVVAAGLLCLPLVFVACRLRSVRGAAAYVIAVGVGVLVGSMLSFSLWILFGGWGPPFLLASVGAGGVLAPALIAASRERHTRKQSRNA